MWTFKYISDDGNPDDWKNFMAEGSKEFKKVLEYYDNIWLDKPNVSY